MEKDTELVKWNPFLNLHDEQVTIKFDDNEGVKAWLHLTVLRTTKTKVFKTPIAHCGIPISEIRQYEVLCCIHACHFYPEGKV